MKPGGNSADDENHDQPDSEALPHARMVSELYSEFERQNQLKAALQDASRSRMRHLEFAAASWSAELLCRFAPQRGANQAVTRLRCVHSPMNLHSFFDAKRQRPRFAYTEDPILRGVG